MSNKAYTMKVTEKGGKHLHQVIEISTGRVVSERVATKAYSHAFCEVQPDKATRISNGFGRLDLAVNFLRAIYRDEPDQMAYALQMEPYVSTYNGKTYLLVEAAGKEVQP